MDAHRRGGMKGQRCLGLEKDIEGAPGQLAGRQARPCSERLPPPGWQRSEELVVCSW